jgi:tRNA U55 pseudouridine synthase TruB
MENVGYKMNIKALMEALEREPVQITKEEKKAFIESVKSFSQLGEGVYGRTNLQELCEKVKYMVEMANQVTLSEGDWFDGITVNRNMKEIANSYKVFEKTAQEMSILQERLSAAYEDIGQGLGRYFEIN